MPYFATLPWASLHTRLLCVGALLLAGCGDRSPEEAGAGRALRFATTPPGTPTERSDAPPPSPPDQGRPIPGVSRLLPADQDAIDVAVRDAIAHRQLPGAVVIVGRRDGILLRRAYGNRRLEPSVERMTEETLFDLASLTKPFTAIAAMQLVEEGRLTLDGLVDPHLPELAGRRITLRHLLTHSSGLPSVNPLRDYQGEHAEMLRRSLATPSMAPPGLFRYSDLGYIALGTLVSRLRGAPLDEVVAQRVLAPLGMSQTRFRPEASSEVAPTERAPRRAAPGMPAPIISGEVNDPRAWRLGGVAGNAGLFSTADDLARFAEALLQGGGSILRPDSLTAMVTPSELVRPDGGAPARRGLGWDMHRWTPASAQAFGHGGYTGTWLWVDPARDAYVVLLSNRVHPDGRGNASPLKQRLLPIALDAAERARPATEAPVLLGIDVLRRDGFASLAGKRIGLMTNDAGRARDGKRSWELLRDAPNVELRALFAPEHGLTARHEGRILDGTIDGIPIHSMFGAQRRPSPESLEGLDAVLIDLQDVGVRYYTYASSMSQMLQAAGDANVPVIVLDRPNPLGGLAVEGPLTDDAFRSFVNHHPLPVRHGLTMAELARVLVAELELSVELDVVRLEGWNRNMLWAETGLTWTAPSPNLRTADQALLYPAVGLLEASNISVGRGTDRPFEVFGAPFLNEGRLLALIEAENLPGVNFHETRFQPSMGRHRGYWCKGLRLEVTDPVAFQPVRTGLAIAKALRRWEQWDAQGAGRLIADEAVMDALPRASLDELEALWAEELRGFQSRRRRALLYPN